MDLPQAPQDTELRNIIDKLAQFVARNGPDFEQMTKNKQKGNPKFEFLFGGEHYNYYQYKVASEQAVLKQQGIIVGSDNNSQNNWNVPPVMNNQTPNPQIEQILQQQDALREQIKQSEQNLSAQHTVLLQQQQAQIEATVVKCELNELQEQADECGINLQDVHSIMQPIIDTCTKDSISNGKAWILQHAGNKQKITCILHCLLNNARKNATDIKSAIESVVTPMFCNASIIANEDQKLKLEKLLKLWESKSNYICSSVVERLRKPLASYQDYQAEQMSKYAAEVALLSQQTKATFDGYQAQHQAFVCHAMQQIIDLQQQKHNIEQQQQQPQLQPAVAAPPALPTANIIPLETIQASLQQSIQSLSQQNQPPATVHSLARDPTSFPANAAAGSCMPPLNVPPPTLAQANNCQPRSGPPGVSPQPQVSQGNNGMDNPFSLPPPGFFLPGPGFLPDFSKPPPGFVAKPEPAIEELLPTAPYYELPAGLLVPLIKLEDTSFKPLDPKDIRLPAPTPPSDRLIAAVKAFYSMPTHDRPRDSEGWEKLGLYEFYKAKSQARAEKEDMIARGLRETSRSPSPVTIPLDKEPTPPRRRYRSRSPSPAPPPPPPLPSLPPPHLSRSSERSGSKGRSRSRSRSRSPRSPRRRHRTSRRRRSTSGSPGRSPQRWNERRRSITPPGAHSGYGSLSGGPHTLAELQELDSSNKGHQMLRRMGWGGSGLGANEQGIDAPISGGDVRDRQDQFKGVGCNLNDPYENFRRNKGAAFITRMKARAEERAIESKLCDY